MVLWDTGDRLQLAASDPTPVTSPRESPPGWLQIAYAGHLHLTPRKFRRKGCLRLLASPREG